VLSRLGYPRDRIAVVADAMLNHGRPLGAGEGTPEAVCLSNADAMAQIARPPVWLFFALKIRNPGYVEGTHWYAEKVRQNWSALIPATGAILQPTFRRTVDVLEG
jgi:uncharacterized protein